MGLPLDWREPDRDLEKIVPALADGADQAIKAYLGAPDVGGLIRSLWGLRGAALARESLSPGQMAWSVWVETVTLFIASVLRDPRHGRPDDLPLDQALKEQMRPLLKLMRDRAAQPGFALERQDIDTIGASRLFTALRENAPDRTNDEGSLEVTIRGLLPDWSVGKDQPRQVSEAHVAALFEDAFSRVFASNTLAPLD